MRKFKSLHPNAFGLPSDYNLVFEQTTKGYKASLPDNSWVGMPSKIIENSVAFQEIRRRERVKAIKVTKSKAIN